MGIVETADGHHDMSHSDIQLRHKTLLKPELLQFNLSATLGLGFPFSGFLKLLFYLGAGSQMFELDLGLHCPALPEIISYIEYCVGNIKAAVRLAFVQ